MKIVIAEAHRPTYVTFVLDAYLQRLLNLMNSNREVAV